MTSRTYVDRLSTYGRTDSTRVTRRVICSQALRKSDHRLTGRHTRTHVCQSPFY